jgi:tetratricopeptide (TPR) repeat protein
VRFLVPLLPLALAACPRSAEGLLESADKQESGRHYGQALAGYRDALRRLGQDDSPAARQVRTRTLAHLADLCYLDMADTRCAAETYQRLLESYPDAPESYQARIHYAEMLRSRTGDLRGAIAQYKALVSAYADRPGADAFQLQAAQGYFELADYAQARTEARALLDRFPGAPSAPQASLLLASCFEMEGRHPEAVAAYQELIQRRPAGDVLARAQLALAKLLEQGGHDEQALAMLLDCLKGYPDPLLIQHEIARLQRKMAEARRLAVAPDAFDHALPKAPAAKRGRRATARGGGGDSE